MEALLTKNGNIATQYGYFTQGGELLRPVGEEEFEYLNNICLSVQISDVDFIKKVTEEAKKAKQPFQFLFTIRDDDDRDFVFEKSRNGGCYSESMLRHVFAHHDGRVLVIKNFKTSADWDLDFRTGSYLNGDNYFSVEVMNIAGLEDYVFWTEDNSLSGIVPAERMGEILKADEIDELFKKGDTYIPPREDDTCSETSGRVDFPTYLNRWKNYKIVTGVSPYETTGRHPCIRRRMRPRKKA